MPFGRDDRAAARRPAEEMAVGILRALRDHAVVARLAVRAVAPPRRARAIDADDGVMDGAGAPGRNSTARTKRLGRQRDGQHDVAEDVVVHRGWSGYGSRQW